MLTIYHVSTVMIHNFVLIKNKKNHIPTSIMTVLLLSVCFSYDITLISFTVLDILIIFLCRLMANV